MSCHPKRGKTKAERFPELSVSLLRSLEVTQRLTPHGSFDRSR
ncbi:hypothetical protein [Leptospira noguchii]|nr:hypothetical protein [Leptospira noguchii]